MEAFDEYRGYVTDLGPDHQGGHARVSACRKEFLIEVSEMSGIQAAINAGINQNVTYSLSDTESAVTDLYNRTNNGAGINVYWAKDTLALGGLVDYNGDGIQNGDDRPNAYHWSGNVEVFGGPANIGGGAYVWFDRKLQLENNALFNTLYKDSSGGVGKNCLFQKSRNSQLEHFAKLVIVTRWGRVFPADDDHPSVHCRVTNENARSTTANADHTLEGCYVAATGVAEEATPAYSNTEFNKIFNYAVAHEIGHLLINAAQHPGGGATALMGTASPPNRSGITAIQVTNADRSAMNAADEGSVQ